MPGLEVAPGLNATLGLVRPEGDKVIVGLGVRLGDVSEVCANDGNVTRVAVTTVISKQNKVFIDAILSESACRRQAEEAWSEDGKNRKRKTRRRKKEAIVTPRFRVGAVELWQEGPNCGLLRDWPGSDAKSARGGSVYRLGFARHV